MPQIGEILLKPAISVKFPYGFLGKVVSVNQSKIVTETIALDEAFDELKVHFSGDLMQYVDNSSGQRNAKASNDILKVGAADGISRSLTVNITDNNITASGTINVVLDYDFELDILEHYMNTYVNPKIEFDASFKWETKTKKDLKVKIASFSTTFPVGPLVLTPQFDIYALVGANGDIKFETKITYSQGTKYGVKFENGQFSPYQEATGKPFDVQTLLSINGKMYAGVSLEFSTLVYGTVEVGIIVTPKMNASASFVLDFEKFASGEFYNTFKDAKIKSDITLGGDVFVEQHLFKSVLRFSKSTSEYIVATLFEKYLLPHFSGYENNSNILKYTVPNDIFFPLNVGMAVYDNLGNLVSKQYHTSTHHNSTNAQYDFSFTGLDNTKDYQAVPFIKFGNSEMKAAPSANFTLTKGFNDGLAIVSPSYGNTYHCGDWIDIFVSGYIGDDWQDYLKLQYWCLVGEPQPNNANESSTYTNYAYTRKEAAYSFTFSPETPSVWDGHWVKLVAINKKNNTQSAPQYIQILPPDISKIVGVWEGQYSAGFGGSGTVTLTINNDMTGVFDFVNSGYSGSYKVSVNYSNGYNVVYTEWINYPSSGSWGMVSLNGGVISNGVLSGSNFRLEKVE
jgi:hypothetical protein